MLVPFLERVVKEHLVKKGKTPEEAEKLAEVRFVHYGSTVHNLMENLVEIYQKVELIAQCNQKKNVDPMRSP